MWHCRKWTELKVKWHITDKVGGIAGVQSHCKKMADEMSCYIAQLSRNMLNLLFKNLLLKENITTAYLTLESNYVTFLFYLVCVEIRLLLHASAPEY